MLSKDKKDKTLDSAERPCPGCGNSETALLRTFERVISSTQYLWHFSMPQVQCLHCGCIYVSPAPTQTALMAYYSDTLPVLATQSPTYDFRKRIELISSLKEKLKGDCSFWEVGANRKTDFHQALEGLVSSVLLTEPSRSSSISDAAPSGDKNVKADLIANYCVLEHVVDVGAFLSNCREHLSEKGYLICEVPNLMRYPEDIAALYTIEHTNHFTQTSLANAASRVGLEYLPEFTTERFCSRAQFAFVAVFRKTQEDIPLRISPQEAEDAKSAFLSGVSILEDFESLMRNTFEDLQDQLDATVFWGANEHASRFLKINEAARTRISLIDSNPNKRGQTVYNVSVQLPKEARENILKAQSIVLFTSAHKASILEDIEERFEKTFTKENVYVLDWYKTSF